MRRVALAFLGSRYAWLNLGMLALTFLLPACGSSADGEARLVIEHLEAIDIGAPPAERQTRVDRLRALRLVSEAPTEVRELCVRAHQALLMAEAEQAAVSRRVDVLAERYPNGGAPERQLAPARDQLAASNAAIAEARALLPECRSRARRLAPPAPRR